MLSRWFHKPEIHSHHRIADRKSSWLELFYDLIFVSSFVQLSRGLGVSLKPGTLVLFSLVFGVLWFSWLGFTLFSNRFRVDDFVHRLMIFMQMLAIASVAAFASEVLTDDASRFSVCYAAAQLIIALLFLRSWVQAEEGKRFSRYWAMTLTVSSAIWLISAFVHSRMVYGFWGFAFLLTLSAPFSRKSVSSALDLPPDHHHMKRRFGYLTIIVLGEVFLQVISTTSATTSATTSLTASTLASTTALSFAQLMMAAFSLIIAFSIWWIYFDDIVSSKLKGRKFNFTFWVYAHLPLHGAIVALGIALQKMVTIDFEQPVPADIRWLASLSLCGVLLAVALLDAVTERQSSELNGRIRLGARLSGAAFFFVLAPIGQGINGYLYLSLISLGAIAQVIFDMLMAPQSTSVHGDDLKVTTTSELAKMRAEGRGTVVLPRRLKLADVLRKNTPSEFRSDFYYYFIDGSWSRFLILMTAGYLFINVVFAGIYLLAPGSIAGSRPNSFADAFYFSVQTFSTIGYGQLSPGNDFSNLVVVIEAAFGIVGVAIITGLFFTRISKPRPGIMFSKPVLISKMNGKMNLMFRVGNTRGNEIVSAEISVSVLRDEVSSEGQHLRRMYDLNLVRSKSPFFALSWMVFHEIDSNSPFFGITSIADVEKRILQLSCILTGHDSTYGQTIYMRHVYLPMDFQLGGSFADILGQLPDGTAVIDYAKFHQLQN